MVTFPSSSFNATIHRSKSISTMILFQSTEQMYYNWPVSLTIIVSLRPLTINQPGSVSSTFASKETVFLLSELSILCNQGRSQPGISQVQKNGGYWMLAAATLLSYLPHYWECKWIGCSNISEVVLGDELIGLCLNYTKLNFNWL